MKFIYYFLFSVIILILLDFFLSLIGYKTNQKILYETNNNIILRTDSVYLVPYYLSDSLGIMKPKLDYNKNKKIPIYFKKFIELEKYLSNSIYNKEGYRGNDINNIQKDKYKIMFIGDSYVFGYDAFPLSNSFVDVVQRKDTSLYCLNFGVGGADLATYELILRNYIVKVKPDLVVCCIYLDNDFVFYNKKIKPNQINDIFITNCGALYKEDYNYSKDSIQVFENYIDAYNNIRNKIYYKNNINIIEQFLQKNSRIYSIIVNSFFKDDYKVNSKKIIKNDYSMVYINAMKEKCKKLNIEIMFTIIPKFGETDYNNCKKIINKHINNDITTYYPHGLSKSHYDFSQNHLAHFNNNGYKFYGEFLYSLIDSIKNYKNTK